MIASTKTRIQMLEQLERIKDLEQRNRELRAELDASAAMHREVKSRMETTLRRLREQLGESIDAEGGIPVFLSVRVRQ